MNDSGVLCFRLCPRSTSAIIATVGSCCLPSTWIAELQTGSGGRKTKPKSFKTAVGLSGLLDIMYVNINQIRNEPVFSCWPGNIVVYLGQVCVC